MASPALFQMRCWLRSKVLTVLFSVGWSQHGRLLTMDYIVFLTVLRLGRVNDEALPCHCRTFSLPLHLDLFAFLGHFSCHPGLSFVPSEFDLSLILRVRHYCICHLSVTYEPHTYGVLVFFW